MNKHLVLAIAWWASILVLVVLTWNLPLGWYLLIMLPYSFGASFIAGGQLYKYNHPERK